MSTLEVQFSDGGLVWLRVRFDPKTDKFEVSEVDGRKWQLSRSQAHLLMLYLQEHLGVSLAPA